MTKQEHNKQLRTACQSALDEITDMKANYVGCSRLWTEARNRLCNDVLSRLKAALNAGTEANNANGYRIPQGIDAESGRTTLRASNPTSRH